MQHENEILGRDITGGAFIIDDPTNRVEAAVLNEFENLSARGGVLAAMESQYQRRLTQEESLYYEKSSNPSEKSGLALPFTHKSGGLTSW